MKSNLDKQLWRNGNVNLLNGTIILRGVQECDKNAFIKSEYENTLMPNMFKEQHFIDILWNEYNSDVSLNCSIIYKDTNDYIGYCGIKDISKENWEVAIVLLKKWTNKGIGTAAMKAFLDTIAYNIGVLKFRVRIDPANYASQKMFEKLGATPNGISKLFLLDDERIRECEKENMDFIDDDLIKVAEKFRVEPRNLLSHVLEYRLEWEI